MKTPSENAFYLSKVKVISGGGLDVHFEVEENCGAEVYRENYHLSSSKDIHPDLQKLFDKLKPIMAQVFYLTFMNTLIAKPEFKATAKQKELSDKAKDEIIDKLNVIGVSLSGKDDNVGVVLTGTITAASNQKMAINSHRMKFADTLYGFEEELEQIVGDIERETYMFLFKGKKAQLEIFDEFGEPMGHEKWDESKQDDGTDNTEN